MRVMIATERIADDLLQHDGHTFIFNVVMNGLYISTGFGRKNGSIHKFDRIAKLLQAHVDLRVAVGQQIGLKNPRKGLVKGIFQQPA